MLTVLMATRNGSETLPAVLKSFEALDAPPCGWKLVVIDNGSTDSTGKILRGFRHRLPLTDLIEPRVGKNYALNTGLEHLEGDLAVFTDDDVFPSREWLVRLRESVDAHPDYSIFGGAIVPRWEVPPPAWVERVDMYAAYSITDPNLADGPATRGTLFGPNLAFRADVFRQGTRFDPSIGPRDENYPMGSESELLHRLRRAGHKSWHVQRAQVEHFIDASHLSKEWVLKRAIRSGRGEYRLTHALNPVPGRWPWYVCPRIVKRLFRIVRASVTRNEEDLLLARWELNFLVGHLIEARLVRGNLHKGNAVGGMTEERLCNLI